MKASEETRLFELDLSTQYPVVNRMFPGLKGRLEQMFYLNHLNDLYNHVSSMDPEIPFADRTLRAMNVSCDVPEKELAAIPRTGPLIIVANHPFGAIEGLVLAAVLSKVRDDVKIMANYMLGKIQELRHFFIFVDPFGRSSSTSANIGSIKDSIRWLKQGGVLGVFPSGEVSHVHLKPVRICDPEWSEMIARISCKTEAPVLPVYFDGRNDSLFQLAGMIHPRLRTVMLPKQFINKKNKTIRMRVGHVIPFSRLSRFDSDQDIMTYLRLRTYIMANRGRESKVTKKTLRDLFKRAHCPVIAPCDSEVLEREIAALPPEQELLTYDEIKVYYARVDQAPTVLRELGRLREITFRQANEGTGRALDIDKYDEYYLHLFMWNTKRKELVGAYRLGQTDVILGKYGVKGFYTSTLFKYRKKLLEQLNPGLELGRSFIRPEYQRNFSALMLLWKGIAAFIAKNPKYTNLFGPVSINNEYHSTSRQLLVRFLELNSFDPDFSRLIKPKKPMKIKHLKNVDKTTFTRVITDVNEVSELIAEIEKDQKGIPVLLRQYLKLGGKLLGFNVDPAFSFVLDGLIWVDMLQADMRTLNKYMGREQAEAFLQFHQADRGL